MVAYFRCDGAPRFLLKAGAHSALLPFLNG